MEEESVSLWAALATSNKVHLEDAVAHPSILLSVHLFTCVGVPHRGIHSLYCGIKELSHRSQDH